MTSRPGVYEERYVWTRRTTSVVIGGALAAAVAIGVALPLVPAVIVFSGGLLAVLGAVVLRRVALRADPAGLTLGGSRWRHRAATAFVPWADVVAVVLWHKVLPDGTLMPYVGVQRRVGAPPLAAPTGHRGGAAAGGLVPDLPADVLTSSRAVAGWRLDRRALARAVAAFAPGVWVLDHDSGQIITGDGA